MKQKALALLLSVAMLVNICIPGTLAIESVAQPVLICEESEHIHTDACYAMSETTVCGVENGFGAHTHGDGCYNAQSTLTCSLSEDENHAHSDVCYTTERVLVCTQQESVGHIHDAGCYTKELICTLQEHTHGEGCYKTTATENTEETKQPEVTAPSCNCNSADGNHAETCPLYTEATAPSCNCNSADGNHAEACPLYTEATVPSCNCNSTDGNHAETCPLYTEATAPSCNCNSADGNHAETCPLYTETTAPSCNCNSADGNHAETCPLYTEATAPSCNCNSADGNHAETCPLYQISVQPEKKECTCGATAGEDGTIIHAENCPLYVAPEKPAHIEGCADGCTTVGCTCHCHEIGLFERLMACKTYDELCNMLDSLTNEDFALLTEEQKAQIDARLDSLVEPVALPPYEYPPFVSVGPIIPYIANTPVRAPRAAATGPHVENGNTNKDGSIIYHDNVTVDKTIEQAGGMDTTTGADNVYKLTMSANAKSMIVDATTGMDIILMLDMSKHMDKEGRVNALKNAVTNFINEVAKRSSGSRIAIIRYAGTSSVLSGSQQAKDGALVTLDATGKNALLGIVNSLNNPRGNSNSDLAMADAVRIFQDANGNHQTDSLGTAYRDRTRVSILFTAGVPGDGSWGDKNDKTAKNIAQAAMSLSVMLKGTRFKDKAPPDGSNFDGSTPWSGLKGKYNVPYTGCGSTVYTVGLNLPEAPDPAEIDTYNELRAYADGSGSNWSLKEESKRGLRVNEYLYRISSHRPTSEHFGYEAAKTSDPKFSSKYESLEIVKWDRNRYKFDVKRLFNGGNMYFLYPDCITRNLDKGYFLTADDRNMADRLNEIFKQISVQTGKPVENLIIRDYIDPSFIPCDQAGKPLEVGATIQGNPNGTVKKDAKGRWYIEWRDVNLTPGDAQGQGKNEFIESIYVKPNGSFGGSNIPTNIPGISGVYPSENSVYPFPKPTVDLPIECTIEGKEINIYLSNEVKAEQLVNIGIKPNGINNAHVKIEYQLIKADGTSVGTYTCNAGETQFTWSGTDKAHRPENDESYTIKCIITPEGNQPVEHSTNDKYHVHHDVTNKEIAANANVNVFRPELTFKDSQVWYGDTVPTNFETENFISKETKWKHNDVLSTNVIMEGVEPSLTLNYAYEQNLVKGGNINTKQDIPVSVTVLRKDTAFEKDITGGTTFVHKQCTPECSWKPTQTKGSPAFLLHVNTCQLTVTKTGGAADEPYVFTVMKDGKKYSEITIIGNGSETICELPVGNYTISEDKGWSWRYNATISGDGNLSSDKPTGEIICTNTKNNDQWLNGFSAVVKNIYGINKDAKN